METLAVVLEEPERLVLSQLRLAPPGPEDVIVDVNWSGISNGTERLLFSGRMPAFPGMGYPLVPGYETVGQVVEAGRESGRQVGETVFVPGANCFQDVRGLFGGAASRLVVPSRRIAAVDSALGEQGVLLALAATALHALVANGAEPPELIVGHGILGRLLARLAVMGGGAPVVWETNPSRRDGAEGYQVIDPETDSRRDYRGIYDVSGDPALLDSLVGRLVRGGEIVLAGFYSERPSFDFAPAFIKEARLRIAAEWQPEDLMEVITLVDSGRLSLAGLITHRATPADAAEAYRTAFSDPACLKMVLDWRYNA
ncbi:MAG: chlorophyll synthesis pathway protein BchC [Steroidobacteraceae bacterium]